MTKDPYRMSHACLSHCVIWPGNRIFTQRRVEQTQLTVVSFSSRRGQDRWPDATFVLELEMVLLKFSKINTTKPNNLHGSGVDMSTLDPADIQPAGVS